MLSTAPSAGAGSLPDEGAEAETEAGTLEAPEPPQAARESIMHNAIRVASVRFIDCFPPCKVRSGGRLAARSQNQMRLTDAPSNRLPGMRMLSGRVVLGCSIRLTRRSAAQ